MVEGTKNVHDALSLGAKPVRVVATEKVAATLGDHSGVLVTSESVFRSLSSVKTPEGLMAFFEIAPQPIESLAAAAGPLILLHAVQDPGNVGAVFRIAAAFDTGGVILGPGCASPFSPKVSRGSAGTILQVPFSIVDDLMAAVAALRPSRRIVAAVPRDGSDPRSELRARNCALLLGGEGHGLPSEIEAAADARITIPTTGAVGSLNVAVAAGILCYLLAAR